MIVYPRSRSLSLIAVLLAAILPFAVSGCTSLPDMKEADVAMSEGRQSDAIRQWQELSDLGFPAATVKLGRAYMKGEGVKKSPSHAVELFTQAAANGDVSALFELGRAYQKGLGVRANASKAAAYYTQAKDMGYSRAQSALEQMSKKKHRAPARAKTVAAPKATETETDTNNTIDKPVSEE